MYAVKMINTRVLVNKKWQIHLPIPSPLKKINFIQLITKSIGSKKFNFPQGQHFVTKQLNNQTKHKILMICSFSGMLKQWFSLDISWPDHTDLGFAASLIHQSFRHFSSQTVNMFWQSSPRSPSCVLVQFWNSSPIRSVWFHQ